MGTKRAFDEELQEFIEQPRHLDHGKKPASFAENGFRLEPFQLVQIAGDGGHKYFRTGDGLNSENAVIDKEFETSAPLPLMTGINADEDEAGCGPVFSANIFSDFFEYNFRRLRHADIYSSMLDSSPRKVIPVGPDHQADVPEFDPKLAGSYNGSNNGEIIYNTRNNGGMKIMGVCVVPVPRPNSDCSTEDDKAYDIRTECECLDGGSIRCVQQHVEEVRLTLSASYGHDKFVGLGMLETGEEVAYGWSREEERLFHEVVYLNPASLGRKFWEQLSIAFPYRTKKELVSYYFNVFILRRRAVQNRSNFLEIDSDDDEWRESYGGSLGGVVGDEDYSTEDGGDDGEHDVVIGLEDQHLEPNSSNKANIKSPATTNEKKITIEDEPEDGQSDIKVLDP